MNIKPRRVAGVTVNIVFIGVFVYLLIFPEKATDATAQALFFCAESIIPSLFIYLVLSKRIVAIRAVSELCTRPVLGSIFTVALGLVCGFPAGARNCVYLHEEGYISKKRAEYLCCLCSGASVSFILAFAGVSVMGSVMHGIKILLIQCAATIVTAAVLYPFLLKGEKKISAKTKKRIRNTDITDAIADSAFLCVRICGFIACFFVLGSLCAGFFKEGSIWAVTVRGIFEFSGGIARTSVFDIDTREVLCCLFLGFGSFSAILQTASVMKNTLSVKPFIISRLIMGALMAVFALVT
ncbi:MAG: hypothetical protein J6A85_07390 [Clostridia bacterium]|nr:hypothetical protein [Clostridia bacterium]